MIFWQRSSWWIALCIAIFELLSFLGSGHVWFQAGILIVLTVATFILALRNITAGVGIALAELIIGSKGHFFTGSAGGFEISIRMGIFAAVMLAWVITIMRSGQTALTALKLRRWIVGLGAVVLWGILNALIRHVPPGTMFADVNAWFYFLYIGPFIDGIRNRDQLVSLLRVFFVAVLDVIVKSLLLLYLFSHNFSWIKTVYTWVRDSGFGEVTWFQGTFFRIFSQSHILIAIGVLLLAAYWWFASKRDWKSEWYVPAAMVAGLSVTLMNLSRSNWLGFAAGGLVWVLLAVFQRVPLKQWGIILGQALGGGVASLILIFAIVYFPIPNPGSLDAFATLQNRFQGDEAAAASRWSSLPALQTAIGKHALLGTGWGTTVTYKTFDPRVLKDHPDGMYTTYAFEWGYLDMMVKVGIFGFLILLGFWVALTGNMWRVYRKMTDQPTKSIYAGLLLGLPVLFVTHMFSPYLNHPIGIGYLLLVMSVVELE